MKKAVLIAFLIFSAIFIGHVRQWTDAGDSVYHVNVLNQGPSAHDLVVTVYIPDLGFFERTGRFDLGNGDTIAKVVYTTKPRPGAYLTRITLSNSEKGVVDSKYIYTII